MRILWHSVAPWLPTGYGTQTALWTRYLRDMGHTVAVSTYFGNPGHTTEWAPCPCCKPIPVLAGPIEGNGLTLMRRHVAEFKPDVIVMLCDMWAIDPRMLPTDVPILAWTPVDCVPLGIGEDQLFRHGPANLRPVAMSAHGLYQLLNAGIEPAGYVPHALDLSLWKPDPDRGAVRAEMGIFGRFAVGLNFNNVDPNRKATAQQLQGFAWFLAKHPDSVLFIHTMARMPGSIDVFTVANRLGLTDTVSVRLSNQERMRDGTFTTQDMIRWYSGMDVVLNATMGEGFGLPALEAQACGTPAIVADNSTGPELRTPDVGMVTTVPWWNVTHNAWWGVPNPKSVTSQLIKVRERNTPALRAAARRNAEGYDINTVGPRWIELLEKAIAGN